MVGLLLSLMVQTNAQQVKDHCAAYVESERFTKAIHAVAVYQKRTPAELCSLPYLTTIEAQPTRLIDKNTLEYIPHVRVQLHMSESSCLYLVKDSDLSITEARCYSAW
ncbi:MAG: hypothetical protein ACK41T_02420 [Pseudobdellovibrio sp.]